MTRLYSNNFSTTLNGAITDVATSMTLTSVTGFPAVGGGDTAQITITDGSNIEVVTATAIAGSVITITRGQEGTSGTAFADLDTVELRETALSFTDVLSADLTPALAGPLDASGTYIGFGGSSTSTAYCINHAGNIPKLVGAANYYWGFTTSSNIYAQAGTSFNNIKFTNDSTRFVLTTNNSERLSVNDSGTQFGASGARITTVLDEDAMGSDSATALATQQSIKAYVDGATGAPEGTTVLSTGEVGGSKFLREDGDGTCSWQAVSGGGDALVANPLSQFAATTSAQLAGVLSDETGSGAAVFATSPTLVTPALGTPTSGVLTNCTGTASGLTAGSVTTNANLTGDVTSVGNATTIAAGSVDLAMLANGTDGELITWDAAGAPAAVAVGTATHVLTSNGAGAAPTFQAAAGGGLAAVVDDTTPQLGGELELNGNYIDFGGSSSATAYNIVSSGGVPQMTGAANYKYTFTTNSLVMNAGTSWYSLVMENTAGMTVTTNNVVRIQANNSGVQFGATGARITSVADEDDMTSDSATLLATQQSIKAYVDATAGAYDYELISSATASASSTIEFTDLTTSYIAYVLIFTDVLPTTDSTVAWLRTSTDNGSTFDSGASAYGWSTMFSSVNTSSTSSSGNAGDTSDSKIVLGANNGNALGEALNGVITIFNPMASTKYSYMNFDLTVRSQNSDFKRYAGAAHRKSADQVDAIQFLMASGTISAGQFRLFGIKGA